MDSITKTMEVIRRAKGGDDESLDRLCRRDHERIRIPVRLRLGPKLRERLQSEDILQSVFLHLLAEFDCFEMRDEGSLLQYLSAMAHHEICARADYWSAKGRDPAREVTPGALTESGEARDPVEVVSGDSAPILEQVASSERREILEQCLSELRENHREVIIQRDFLGLGWREIAENLQYQTESAARECRARALTALTRLLLERGVHEGTE